MREVLNLCASGNAPQPLGRPERPIRSFLSMVLAVATVAFTASSAGAQPAPLTAAEQEAINRSIDRGVKFLQAFQGPLGTWAPAKENHHVGYAAMPGLTLLACGVPASDPGLKRTAKYVRKLGIQSEHTYEVALSILFLDRLGDP